jgi:hypothetical protein
MPETTAAKATVTKVLGDLELLPSVCVLLTNWFLSISFIRNEFFLINNNWILFNLTSMALKLMSFYLTVQNIIFMLKS